MPLLINVGLNRKASKDFQSVGVSLNLTAELDQGLLSDPQRLQSEIDRIYGQAEEALERQITAMGTETKQDAPSRGSIHSNAPAVASGPQTNGKSANGSFHGGPVRPATESQVRALRATRKWFLPRVSRWLLGRRPNVCALLDPQPLLAGARELLRTWLPCRPQPVIKFSKAARPNPSLQLPSPHGSSGPHEICQRLHSCGAAQGGAGSCESVLHRR